MTSSGGQKNGSPDLFFYGQALGAWYDHTRILGGSRGVGNFNIGSDHGHTSTLFRRKKTRHQRGRGDLWVGRGGRTSGLVFEKVLKQNPPIGKEFFLRTLIFWDQIVAQ